MTSLNKKQWDQLWINVTLARCINGYDLITDGALAVKEGKIAWLGSMADLSQTPSELALIVKDGKGRVLTPGFIDCHTHVVYAGNRANEFEMRLQGKTYAEIAKAGGGIQSTVRATRAASFEELLEQSMKRVKAMQQHGVKVLEIKSGYGLDLANEIKMLRVAKTIGEKLGIKVCLTFLGAHALPLEYQGRADDYIEVVCKEMLPQLAHEGLVHHVDVFCENIAFNLSQTEKVFQAATNLGLRIKCHAEQLSEMGASVLSAGYKALSVDHLEFLTAAGVNAIAESKTVAVLLPGAFYYLREKQLPPFDLLREKQVPMAIATDCNPGTSPVVSLPLMMNMACTLFRLTPEEALMGVTHHAARALGLEDSYGSLEVGKTADVCLWDIKHPAELAYSIGMDSLVN